MIGVYYGVSSGEVIAKVDPQYIAHSRSDPLLVLTTPGQLMGLIETFNEKGGDVHSLREAFLKKIERTHSSVEVAERIIERFLKTREEDRIQWLADLKSMDSKELEKMDKKVLKGSNTKLEKRFDRVSKCLVEDNLDEEIEMRGAFWTKVNDERAISSEHPEFNKEEIQYHLREKIIHSPYMQPTIADLIHVFSGLTYNQLTKNVLSFIGSGSYSYLALPSLYVRGSEKFENALKDPRMELPTPYVIPTLDSVDFKLSVHTNSDDNVLSLIASTFSLSVHKLRHDLISRYLRITDRSSRILSFSEYMKQIEDVRSACSEEKRLFETKRPSLPHWRLAFNKTCRFLKMIKKAAKTGFIILKKLIIEALIVFIQVIKLPITLILDAMNI